MKLSLSVRVAESFSDKTKTMMPFEGLALLAKENGYSALCMRASVAGIHTPAERIAEMRGRLDELGLSVSMVTGDFAIPRNDEAGPQALRNIAPYLDLAEAFGCDLIRICMKREDDIPWAGRACDEASERKIRLAHQCHVLSLFETVSRSLEVLRRVGRRNFGIIYEPANLHMCGQDYGLDTIEAFAPYLFNVYVQNYMPNPQGKAEMETWSRGTFRFDHIPLGDPRGIDWRRVFDGLASVGYDGYVTVHQALAQIMAPPEAAKTSAEFLRSVGRFEV
jgi:sugar phosphate isomerase/epimerase